MHGSQGPISPGFSGLKKTVGQKKRFKSRRVEKKKGNLEQMSLVLGKEAIFLRIL